MPRKAIKPTMGERIDTLESQFGAMQMTIASLVDQMKNQSIAFAELSKQFLQMGKRVVGDSSTANDGSTGYDTQFESRLSGKKEEMKVKLSRLSMEGATIHWFNLLLETEDDLSWVKLKKALIARYGGRRLENPFEELSTLKQTGRVEEFVEAFELLSSQVGRLPEEQYLGYFMGGLKDPIRRRVRTFNPNTRMAVMRIAKDVESELKEGGDDDDRRYKKGNGDRVGRNDWYGSRSRYGPNTAQIGSKPNSPTGWSNLTQKTGSIASNANFSNSSNSLVSTGRKSESDTRSDAWKGVQSFHSDEIAARRAKGLCFKCGGKYHPTLHKCPEKSLCVLILGEGEVMDEDGEIVAMEGDFWEEEKEVEVECKSMGVLGSMGGYNTMKVEGKIADVGVLVLIDSGATHNFISPQITTALGLTVTPMADKHIKLGDGHKIVSKGGLDVVLGVSWLCTLGKVMMDWQSLSMQFLHNNQLVKLQGQGNREGSFLNSFLEDKQGREQLDWWWAEHHQIEANQDETPAELIAILQQFHEVFKEKIQLPLVRSKVHHIKLFPDHGFINVRPYRYPHHQKAEIERQVSELLQAGVIRPSMSSCSSPVILVKKKDKSWRMCVDYRALNKATVPDKYPIPIIRVHPDDVPKTAFRTHNGHYEYLVMPFGLMNASATFQATMNYIFRPFLRKFVLVFFDDILVYSRTIGEHQLHLMQVLTVLQENCFVANQAKCKFGCSQVDYLGHIISGNGVAMDPEKRQCIIDWPIPKTVKGVRGFLGLTGYYRKFIRDYGKMAKPLTDLTKKDNFVWGSEAMKAFNLMKQVITSPPVLVLPNFDLPFEVECDAAGRGIGAVLMQQRRPIAFFSKALSDGNQSNLYHKSLKHFLQQRITSPDQQGWLAKLLGYQFEVKYKPGLDNKAADALSRCYDEAQLHSLVSYPTWADSHKLLDEVAADRDIQDLIKELLKNPTAKPGYSVKNGVLFYHDRLVLSPNSPTIPLLLEEFHSTPAGGHSGFLRTYRRLVDTIYWVGMQRTVRDFVRACDVCQRQKYSATTPGGLLQPLPIPNAIWEDLSIDFITGLPKSRGFDAILVVVDRLSKYSHFILLKHPYNAKTIAEVFVKEVVRLHGIPHSIVSDRDPLFVSNFWLELFKLQGTKLQMSSAYHPESDGQTEVINRCLESYLRCFAADHAKAWSSWIAWAEYWFNTTFHVSLGTTPFEVVYGRKPPTLVRFLSNETKVAAVALELEDRDEALRQLKLHLQKAQEQMTTYANKKRRDLCFTVGEWVFLKLRPHRQQTVVRRINQKLAPRFYGPFKILARVGEVAYKLYLPDTSRIHPVFHVSLLKKVVGDYHSQGELPKNLEVLTDDVVYLELIMGARITMKEGVAVKQSLIKWKDQSLNDVIWEDDDFLRGQFPEFSLEDKTVVMGEGIDRTMD
ncbi:hypothetical protein TSUD_37640 [Trifolium subterraneum]|uniref:Integrase catalytic domain-containing protein n=1 Tax=Trifolium subterraneum TaxID=3900 RepID=A0A2Z6MLH0_TRISU|nr:hypothetical protein TSUD_37640 [Trifolium subterraneum]